MRATARLPQLQEIADLAKELAAEAEANEEARLAELEALEREREEMRLTLAQLDPELLEQAAPEVKNAQKLERRAEAANTVFEMCVLRPCPTSLLLCFYCTLYTVSDRLIFHGCFAERSGRQVQTTCRGSSCRAGGAGCGSSICGRARAQRR